MPSHLDEHPHVVAQYPGSIGVRKVANRVHAMWGLARRYYAPGFIHVDLFVAADEIEPRLMSQHQADHPVITLDVANTWILWLQRTVPPVYASLFKQYGRYVTYMSSLQPEAERRHIATHGASVNNAIDVESYLERNRNGTVMMSFGEYVRQMVAQELVMF